MAVWFARRFLSSLILGQFLTSRSIRRMGAKEILDDCGLLFLVRRAPTRVLLVGVISCSASFSHCDFISPRSVKILFTGFSEVFLSSRLAQATWTARAATLSRAIVYTRLLQ